MDTNDEHAILIEGGPHAYSIKVTTPGGEQLRVTAIEFMRVEHGGLMIAKLEVRARVKVRAVLAGVTETG